MVEVHFFEKPGCINNTKQKQLMAAKGYKVVSYDLIKKSWTAEELKVYLQDRPVDEWFNLSAPRIKSGEINIEVYNEESALEEMVKDHYLIKRPLLRVGDKYACGFDSPLAKQLVSYNFV